jgi:predicted acetylornithine/succinylornithine family transaminase
MDWIKTEKEFIFQTYRRQPLVLVKSRGSYVWDLAGQRYLDFFSGLAVNNLGHCHPAVTRAVSSQIRTLGHTSNVYYTLPQIRLARDLVRRAFPGKAFFSNSGAEANECAVKLARRWGKKHGNRHEIVTFKNSFHGRTLATLTLTGQDKYQKDFNPLVEKVHYADFNDMESVRRTATAGVCAVFIEPVQGEGGLWPADPGFLKELKSFCAEKKLLLIFDEVQCGMGRTGRLFAWQHYGVRPDVLVLAKGVGGGLPMGVTIAGDEIAELLGFGDHASTFGGNPVVCAAAEQVLKIMDERFLASVRKRSALLFKGLGALKEKFPHQVRDVRGLGLMAGLDLKIPGEPLVAFARNEGLLINCVQNTVLRFLPPLNVTEAQIRTALRIIEKALQGAAHA